MTTLSEHLKNEKHWDQGEIAQAFDLYADLTQEGMDKQTAFELAFPRVNYQAFGGDGYLSQHYCGSDRDYD